MKFRNLLLILPVFFVHLSYSQFNELEIDSLAQVNLKASKTVGAYISISRGDSLLVSSAYGVKNLEDRTKFTDSTVFPISSNTKAFNSLLLSKLAEENKLDFYRPIIEYLPDLRFKDDYITSNVTLIDLLTHRVGIPRYDFTYYMLDDEQENANEAVFRKLKYLDAAVPFRTAFQYGNNQYILAAFLHEQLTGDKWEKSLQQNLLNPLGLKDTHTSLKRFKADPHRSLSYQDSLEVNIDHVAPMYEVSGMGNMFSTVRDLQKWGDFLVNGNDSVLSKDYVDFNHMGHFSIGYEEPYPGFSGLQYGLGWFVFDYFGHKVVMHHGDNIGHQSLVFLLPDDKLSGVIVANNAFGKRSFAFTTLFGILDMATGRKLNDWNELIPSQNDFVPKHPDSLKTIDKVAPAELRKFTGSYHHEGFGDIKIFIGEDEDLMLNAGHFRARLEPYQPNTFKCVVKVFDEDYIFKFKEKEKGIISLETDLIERTLPPIEFKKKFPAESKIDKMNN